MATKEVTVSSAREVSKGFHTHAAGCKRDPSECVRCQLAIKYFESLPLTTLAEVLQG